MVQTRQPRNKPTPLWSLIFEKVGKKYTGVKIAYSINSVGKIGQIYAKNSILDDLLIPYTKKKKRIKMG